jgi:hypothetical protein
MLEQDIRDTYRRMAAAEMPPSPITIPAVGRAGRTGRRRRQAGLISAPVLAATAVLVIAVVSVIVTGGPRPSGPASPKPAPAHFSLDRPYGWIPVLSAGGLSDQVVLTRVEESVIDTRSARSPLEFDVFAAGRCRMKTQMVVCAKLAGGGEFELVLGRRVGTIDGSPAYWNPGGAGLTWQYARGGWAELASPGPRPARLAELMRLARRARFGTQAGPPVVYPLQLRSVPATWRVSSVIGGISHGRVLAADLFTFSAGPVDLPFAHISTPSRTPEFSVLNGAACPVNSGRRTTKVIHGSRVTLANYAAGVPHILCAPSADGHGLAVLVGSRPEIGVVDLFGHHLRLFGSDPAKWTTKPTG